MNKLTRCWMVLAVVLCASAVFAQDNAQFARANDEFGKKQFPEAIRDYEGLVKDGQWSAPLFYNLGNAYFRTGDFGRAILNYERALALEPRHPESTANLILAREEARALELQQTGVDNLLKYITPNQSTLAAVVGFWAAAIAFTGLIVRRRRPSLITMIGLLGLGLAIIASLVTYRVESFRGPMAIVVRPDARARVATADNASSILQLPAGSEIRIVSQRGDWVYASLPNNLRGWIPAASVESVRL